MRLFRPLRTPALILASVAVSVAVTLPVGEPPASDPVVQRVRATPQPATPFTPTTLAIPTIDVDAPVVPVGTEPDGKMSSPTNAVDVGWWAGRKPGEGNVLLAAHHDWSGQLGTFYRLEELRPGDEVVVAGEDGQAHTYRVAWVRNYDGDIDATELLDNSSGEQVATLITCGGPFDRSIGHHLERVVARAELVSA